MLRKLLMYLLLTASACAVQQDCTGKANECKDPVTNPKHFKEQHCTCFTCESGTPQQKVLCTSDENEAGRLQARIEALPQGDNVPTANVQGTVQSAIEKDPSLASANVSVDVKNGKAVELSGTVPSKDAKDAAERIAKENSGGLKVKNHLKVASATTPDKSDKTKPDSMSNPKP